MSGGVAHGLNGAMGYAPGQVAGLTAPAGAITDFDLGRSLVSGLGGSVVGNAARGGKLSAANIAADAFGNVIGDSLAAANSNEGTYVSQEERLRDQFWEQSLGPVASRSPSRWQSTMSDADARWLIGDRAETYGNQPRVLVADNWARDPIQNRVVSDAPFTVNLPMVDSSGGPAAGDRLMWRG